MVPLLQWVGEVPALRRPLLIVSLEGFIDAGGVASTAALFLRHRWQAEVVATFDRDAFIDYRARRPTAVVDSGVLRRVEWPSIELLAARLDGTRDVLLLLGVEPDMQWEAFFDTVADVCRTAGVEAVVGLGAYPAAAPHTRPIRIMRARNSVSPDLFAQAGPIPGYTGPVGIGTALHAALAERDVAAVGLWAEVPHYIAASPNPAGALALVRLVSAELDVAVDTTELEAAVKAHNEQVDTAVAEHPEAREMVALLERHLDSGGLEDELPTGEDIAAEIERFLRSQGG